MTDTEIYAPKFAVLLAAYNGMQYLEEQITSILAQKNVALQLFVSVDKSNDGTESFLLKMAEFDKRITLLKMGNTFGSAAPNFYRLIADVDFSDYHYVSLSDQDDIWDECKLWRAHCEMKRTGAIAYSSNFTAFWSDGLVLDVNKALPQRDWDFLFESAGPGCTYVFSKDFSIELQIAVKSSTVLGAIEHHDWLFYAIARSKKYLWCIDNWSSMKYRQHKSNQVGVNVGYKSFFQRVKIVLNGQAFKQVLLISHVCAINHSLIVRRGLCSGRLGYLWLALKANQCRRSRKDRIYFFISCILLAVINPLI